MQYIKIMDIVGQLTIDAAKTGEFEPIPKEIEDFLRISSDNLHIFKSSFLA